MGAGTFLYFAYGSNMLSRRLKAPERCPSARPLGVAELRRYELRWHKRSKKDGSGKCDIVPSTAPDAVTLGVLYEIAGTDRTRLDSVEGLHMGYEAIEVSVLSGGALQNARCYQATDTDASLRPLTWYRALVVAGAKEHALPDDYIEELEAVAADQDHDAKRHAENMALIEGARA